ncbi:hypothetical protein D9M71_342140 [compost metagenome]
MVADHQGALVAQLDVADQFATVLGLVQVGFVGLHLHAALAQDDITCEGGDLLFLLVARGFGGDVGRRIFQRSVVVHARTRRLDIGTGTIGAGFGQLRGGEFVARHPVEVAVIGAAGDQALAFGLGDQGRLAALGFTAFAGLGRDANGRAHGAVAVHRARRQALGAGLGRTGPAASGGSLAVELLCGDDERGGYWLEGQQAAGHQQGELSTKRGGSYCHLISPGFLRAFGPLGRTPLDGLKKMLDNKA